MTMLGTIRRSLTLSALVTALAIFLSASAAHRPPQVPPAAQANEIVLAIDPGQSTVHYTVNSSLHTVHGSFAVKSGGLRIDPGTGKAGGEIVVDAASGQSGNGSRDKKMSQEVLESSRFTEIVFRPDRVEGLVRPQGDFTAQLDGKFVVHGSEHEFSVPVQAELTGEQWKGTARFSIPYCAWGLKNPSNFLLKVDHAVAIEVDIAGTIQSPSAEGRSGRGSGSR